LLLDVQMTVDCHPDHPRQQDANPDQRQGGEKRLHRKNGASTPH